MMKMKFLILSLLVAASSYAAQIKDVRFACDSKACQMAFAFSSEKNLPTFYQKYDAAAKKLTFGFSETTFALGEGSYDIDDKSKFVRNMKVYKETFRGTNFLKIELSVGASVTSDKNEISLDKSSFLVKFKNKGGKAWTLSKLFADRKKAAEKQALLDKKAAEKASLEEKKRLADEKKAAERQAALDKKAAEKQAALDKKAAAKAALEEKKRLAEEKKAAEKKALLDKKAAEKAAKEEEKRLAEQQKLLDKAIKEGGAISALLPGIKEMTVLIGSGMEQFRLVTESPIDIKNVSGPDKASTIFVGLAGPQKSPVFKIGAGSLVKSVTWGANGIKILLQTGVNPVMLVQDGALILQTASTIKKDGFIFWSAQPNGIFIRDWMKAVEEKPNFDAFVKKMATDSKKIVSGSQTFHLRPVVRELIVVADEIEFYAAPNENAQVLQRLVFGDRLVSLDMTGLYRKVQFGNRIGYVNRRAVSFFDELSAVQAERLKQVDKDRGSSDGESDAVMIGSQLDGLYEDRVTYSSFGRRDPFVEIKGLVEEGINIDQVELVGIIWESEVPMAILVESKNHAVSYTLKEGDKILNGKVLKITQTDVLFLIQEFGVSRRYSMGLPDKFGGK